MQSTSSAHSVHLVKSYLGHVELKKKYESHSSTGDLCLPTHTQPCTHSTAGLGNTVKYLTVVLNLCITKPATWPRKQFRS